MKNRIFVIVAGGALLLFATGVWAGAALVSASNDGRTLDPQSPEPAATMAPTQPDTETTALVTESGEQPDLKEFLGGSKPPGLHELDTPKHRFAFGVGGGILLLLIGALVKISIVIAIVIVFVVYVRSRTGHNEEHVRKDPVDSLIAAFDALVDKVESERDRHLSHANKLTTSLTRLKTGVQHRVSKRKRAT